MVRGRGKGKKQAVIASHEGPGSDKEEKVPAYRRRGRPMKPVDDDNGQEEEAASELNEDGKDAKDTIPSKDVKSQSPTENGRKRKRPGHTKENTNSVKEDNGVGTKLSTSNSTMSTGFRQIGSRRKNKPRRAAEAVVECK
ncbi:RNA polymerase-associated protein LEO1 [Ricinus communis]|uniref:Uncharacterized protein n=1 Tax=Ricinus communis TaxID=3988 RepID=B9T275_RICCO|nr:RNA polymerase-associated protein LEO1 [Ricinus communis]XP_015582795.1 RNA polymerase-associated protein LEO1 [Ricinus communis]XP_015582797.1 RNA polymerase-associated protein LEO1 [Ricinus communis]EEF30046.1 conserved hypothetical protein [Ricinus communis]|eukprot:XP_002532344.1 RNA polymerase-associated protein LEO1 [Ricinus communis]